MPVFIESLVEVLLKYWKIILPVVIAVALIVGAYFKGYHAAENKCEAAKYEQAYVQVKEQLKASQKELADLKQQKDKFHVIVKTQIEKIPEVVTDNRACDLQPDALKLWNSVRHLPPG